MAQEANDDSTSRPAASADRSAGREVGPMTDLMDAAWIDTATEDDLVLLFGLGE